MEIDPADLDGAQVYQLLVGIVVPRPIAWVTSLDDEGSVNAAPFSCFTFISKNPPLIAIVVGHREDGLKDTASNIHNGSDFVLNAVTEDAAEPMHETSAEYPSGVSEVEALGLDLSPSLIVKAPRIDISPTHLECRLRQILEFGVDRDELIVGEVVHFHVDDRLYADGRVAIDAFHPLARLGGPNYAKLGERVTMGFSSGYGGEPNKREAQSGR